jgi:NAD+ synthase/NAD+ synthase (glutamine-hydrolysing)
LDGAAKAAEQGAQLAVFPEMALIGYPPRDLLLFPALIDEAERAAVQLAARLGALDLAVVIGTAGRSGAGRGRPLQNQALVLEGGRITARYAKRLLPTYDVFDEARYFEPGEGPLVVERRGLRLALTICEDIWNDGAYWPRPLYRLDPLEAHPDFDVLINLSASPFSAGKQALREDMLGALARRRGVRALYVNQVGANDELIFDGRSFALDAQGRLLGRAEAFGEDVLTVDLEAPGRLSADLGPEAETWAALVLGVGDYCRKNGLDKAVLGLSGGIDSSVTAALAAEALGPEQVGGLIMPSPYSSGHSVKDAEDLAANLGLASAPRLPIAQAMEAFGRILAPVFKNLPADSTEENIQARIRGTLLMAAANKFGGALLTTGNKSEISVGYCTIYGDMCGALAVIGDLYKTEVFRLARWLNAQRGQIIPQSTLDKPPSAELRPDQTDQDSLPPYEELDQMLKLLLEERRSPRELVALGFEPATVKKTAALVKGAEFKRRQAAPVLKITGQAFGVGWRMPVTCRSVFDENDGFDGARRSDIGLFDV